MQESTSTNGQAEEAVVLSQKAKLDLSAIRIEPLEKRHNRGAFCCSNATIQNYCRNNARKNHEARMVRVSVACQGDSVDVLGYYYLCLSSYKVGRIDDAADLKFGRVDAVPAVYLGMIGVHTDYAAMGIGKLLMADAIRKTAKIAELAGVYALTLDALDESLVPYYRDQFGFISFKANERSGIEMFLPISTILAALASTSEADK